MYRNLEPRTVLPQSSISLNRSAEAPKNLSEDGYNRVMASKEIQDLDASLAFAKEAVLEKYPTLTTAQNADDPLYAQYLQLYRDRVLLKRGMLQKAYTAEYKRHFETLPISVEGGSPQEIEEQAAGITNAPQHNEKETDDVQSGSPDVSQANMSATGARLHGLPGTWRSGIQRPSSVSAYNNFSADVAQQGKDDAAICAEVQRWMRVVHPINQFEPGREPEPGSFNCRFCDLDLRPLKERVYHVHQCSQKEATARA